METIGHFEGCMRGREAADYLGLTYGALMQSYKDKGIETIRIGGIPYFQKAELDNYRARREAAKRRREQMEEAAFRVAR